MPKTVINQYGPIVFGWVELAKCCSQVSLVINRI